MIKAYTLEVVLTQRYAFGLTGHAAFSANRVTENRTVHEYDREPTLWQTNNNGRPWRVTGVAAYELPFGPGRAFLDRGGVLSQIARGWSVSGTYEYQPGALLNWGNIFFNGNYADIKKDKPEIAFQPDGTIDPSKTGFNTEAGFVKATAEQPAAFQKRVFPFRVDGVRGQSFSMTNMSVARTFALGGRRTFQFRADVQNLFNRQHYQNPNLDPTSTNFGQVTQVNNTVMRFITFNTILRF